MMAYKAYRGKAKEDGRWVYGAYYPHMPPLIAEGDEDIDNIRHFIIVVEPSLIGMERPTKMVEVISDSVGQYIGRIDVHSEHVFEGDILLAEDFRDSDVPKFIGVVEFNNSSFLINQGDFMKHYRWMDYDVEVIGNICDDNLEDLELRYERRT